jgi:hypothetical protein
MNAFIKITALSIAAALVGVSAQAAEFERIDAAAMEIQGGPIAPPVIRMQTKAERLVDTSRAAVKAEQARAWAAGDLDHAYVDVYGTALPNGTVKAGNLRMVTRNSK